MGGIAQLDFLSFEVSRSVTSLIKTFVEGICRIHFAWDSLLAESTVRYLVNQFWAAIALASQYDSKVWHGGGMTLTASVWFGCPGDWRTDLYNRRLLVDCWSQQVLTTDHFQNRFWNFPHRSSPRCTPKHTWRRNTIPTDCLLIPRLCSATQSQRA